MPLSARCPRCQSKLTIPDHLLGKAVKCVKCGQAIGIKQADPITPAGADATSGGQPDRGGSKSRMPVMLVLSGVVSAVLLVCVLGPLAASAVWYFTRSNSVEEAKSSEGVAPDRASPDRPTARPETPPGNPTQDHPKDARPDGKKNPPHDPVKDPPKDPPIAVEKPEPTPSGPPALIGNVPETVYSGKPLREWLAQLNAKEPGSKQATLGTLSGAGPNALVWGLPQICWLLLNDESAEVRLAAAKALKTLGPWAEPALPALVEVMSDRDESVAVRKASVEALGATRAAGAIAPLAQLLKDPSLRVTGSGPVLNVPEITYAVTQTLTTFGANSVPTLVPLLDDTEPDVRIQALTILGDLGPDAKAAMTNVAKLTVDPNPLVRGVANQALAKIDPDTNGAVKILKEMLKHQDPAIRLQGLDKLGRLEARAVAALPDLIPLTEDPEWLIRQNTILVIRGIGPAAKESVPALTKACKDKDVRVRRVAAGTLGYVGADARDAVPVLGELLQDDDRGVADAAVTSLNAFGPDGKPAVKALLDYTKKQAIRTKGVTQCSLRWMGAEAAAGLAEGLGDTNPSVRFWAITHLASMGPEAEPALPAIRKALADESPSVRGGAARCLWALGPRAHPVMDDLIAMVAKPGADRAVDPVTAIRFIGLDSKDVERVLELTRNPTPEVRTAAVRALIAGGEDGLRHLNQLAKAPDRVLQDAARQALPLAEKEAELRRLHKQLSAEDAAERWRAAAALLAMEPKRVEPLIVLASVLRDGKQPVETRLQAAAALQSSPVRVVPWSVVVDLREAVKDPLPEVQSAARSAFLKVDAVQANMAGIKTSTKPTRPTPVALGPAPVKFDKMPARTRGSSAVPVQTLVRLFVPTSGAQARPVLVLDRPQEPGPIAPGMQRGILARELVRQAFAMTAREHLGFVTRDQSLRETFVASPGYAVKARFMLTSTITPGKSAELALNSVEPTKLLWKKSIALPDGGLQDYFKLTEDLERLSRTEWVQALKDSRVDPATVHPASTASSPVEAAEPLDAMNHLSQYAALRLLHAAQQKEGESPNLTADLVRGYAHLGVLIEFHLTSEHKCVRARSLLYAQRLIAQDPRSPWGYWHRAYARALAGAHAGALDDLREAEQKAMVVKNAGGKVPEGPAWLADIDAYCHFNGVQLQRRPGQLAHLLAFLAFEDFSATGPTVRAGRQTLDDNPECARVYDGICRIAGVAASHRYTTQALTATSQSIGKRLRTMSGLPRAVGDHLQGAAVDDGKLAQALVDATTFEADVGEPSWSSIGWAIRDTRLSQIFARLYFMKAKWGVATDEAIDEFRPLISAHPYAGLIDLYSDRPERVRAANESKGKVDPAEVDLTQMPPLTDPNGGRPGIPGPSPLLAEAHADPIFWDLTHASGAASVTRSKAAALSLMVVSPYAPRGRANLIQVDWPGTKGRAAEWEKDRQPLVLRTLAARYRELGLPQDAERCLKVYLEVSPDYEAYSDLAELYKAQKKMVNWQETLEASLKIEDVGLNHADARVRLARQFMEQKEYRKALPYAEAAADSYAAWAMICASECNEALGELDRAELWIRRVSERYPPNRAAWLQWCKRTGRGNLEAAQKLAGE